MRAYLVDVQEVAAVDPLTVRLRTLRPVRVLLAKLSFVLIVPEGSTAESLRDRPDGTGPFTLDRWDGSRSVVLARHEGYWAPAPSLRRVEFSLARSPDEAARGLLSGEYQFVQCNSLHAQTLLAGSRRHRVIQHDNIYLKFLGYDLSRQTTPFSNVQPNPFLNRLVRRALHLGIDRQALVAGLSSGGTPARQLVPRFIFGFNPGIPEGPYDPDEARALLRQAGFGQGFSVTLHVRAIFREAAVLPKGQLARLGIAVHVEALPDADMFARGVRRELSFWLSRYGCPTGDASNILDGVVHSAVPARGFGSYNWGHYTNPNLDGAIEASAAIDTPEDRLQALHAIMATAMDELVLIPLYLDRDGYAMDSAYSFKPRNDSYIRAADIRPAR